MSDLSINWQHEGRRRCRSLSVMARVVLGLLAGSALCSAIPVVAREAGSRTVQYSFSLRNQSNRLVKEAELWTYTPNQKVANQQRVTITASHPHELIEDEFGNRILHFTIPTLPPYAITTITIRTELDADGGSHPAAVRAALKPYLQPSPGVESTAPAIVTQAKALQGKSALDTAGNIHTWVVQNIQASGYSAVESGALATLRDKRGDCTEFMDLFVALARAAKLPARGIAGYLHPESGILRPTEFHNWAEFYADGTWQIADPHRNRFRPPAFDYVVMRIIGPSAKNPMAEDNRFRFKGEGLAVSMNE